MAAIVPRVPFSRDCWVAVSLVATAVWKAGLVARPRMSLAPIWTVMLLTPLPSAVSSDTSRASCEVGAARL